MANLKKNPVMEHISFFSDKEGQVTSESMISAHNSQCIYKGVWLKTLAICNLMGQNPHNKLTVSKLINPTSTGIWKSDGTFDEEMFGKLMERGVISSEHDNNRIITKKHFMEHLDDNKNYRNNNVIACYILKFIPVSWKRITNGSIDELFEYYGNVIYEGGKAFTEQKLFEFYTNPNKVMKERCEQLEKEKDEDTDEYISSGISDCSLM